MESAVEACLFQILSKDDDILEERTTKAIGKLQTVFQQAIATALDAFLGQVSALIKEVSMTAGDSECYGPLLEEQHWRLGAVPEAQ